jgi:hypothetical protein
MSSGISPNFRLPPVGSLRTIISLIHRLLENGPLKRHFLLNPISPASPYLMLVLPEPLFLSFILPMEEVL